MGAFYGFLFTIVCALPKLVSANQTAASGCRCGSAAFLTLPHVNLTMTEQIKPCAAYKLVDARGSGEPQGVSLMFQNVIQMLLIDVTDSVSQSVEYPAGFDQNVTLGVSNTLEIIKFGLQDCPKQKYALFGYSQGVTVLLEALAQLNEKSRAAVASVVFVGNPYRLLGKLSNVDSQGRSDNRTAMGLFATQAMASNQTFPKLSDDLEYSRKVLDICLENDIVCAFDAKCPCTLASDHLSYGLMDSVQTQILNHVLSRR